MAKPVTSEERERIVAEFATGKSCQQIAKEFGRSPDTISRIAKAEGHEFGHLNAVHAREVKAAYDSERRSGLIAKAIESAEKLFGQMFAEAHVWSFGGRDNTYNEHWVPEPDFKAKRDISAAISSLMKTAMELDRAEQAAGADEMLVEFTMAIQKRREGREQAEDDDAD